MKHLAYLFVFLVLLSSVSAICYNHNDSPFCSKDDPTCAVEDEADTDNDGWSNSCDAFPENEYLWIDYDGDNIGYGTLVYDCDDFDDQEQTYCGQVELLEEETEEDTTDENVTDVVDTDLNITQTNTTNSTDTNESNTNETSTGNDDSSGSSGSSFTGNVRPKKNSGVTIYPNQTQEEVTEEETIVAVEEEEEEAETFIEREIVPLVDPTPINEPENNQITGAVTGTTSEIVWWPFVVLVAGIFFLFFLAKRRKKQDN